MNSRALKTSFEIFAKKLRCSLSKMSIMKVNKMMALATAILWTAPYSWGQSTLPNLMGLNLGFNGQFTSHGIFSDIETLEGFQKPDKMAYGGRIGITFTIKSFIINMQSGQSGFINSHNSQELMHFDYESHTTDILLGYRFLSNSKLNWSPLIGVSFQKQRYAGRVNAAAAQNLSQHLSASSDRTFVYHGLSATTGFLIDWFPTLPPGEIKPTADFSNNRSITPSFNVQVLGHVLPFEGQWSTATGQTLSGANHQDFSLSLMLGFSLHIAPYLMQ